MFGFIEIRPASAGVQPDQTFGNSKSVCEKHINFKSTILFIGLYLYWYNRGLFENENEDLSNDIVWAPSYYFANFFILFSSNGPWKSRLVSSLSFPFYFLYESSSWTWQAGEPFVRLSQIFANNYVPLELWACSSKYHCNPWVATHQHRQLGGVLIQGGGGGGGYIRSSALCNPWEAHKHVWRGGRRSWRESTPWFNPRTAT